MTKGEKKMGKIKAEKQSKSNQEYKLEKFDAAFLKALVISRNQAYNQYQSSIQAFLSVIGHDKMGIADPESYEFSADLDAGTVSVTKGNPNQQPIDS